MTKTSPKLQSSKWGELEFTLKKPVSLLEPKLSTRTMGTLKYNVGKEARRLDSWDMA